MPDNNGIAAGGDISGNAAVNTGSGSVTQHIQGTQASRDGALERIDEILAALLQTSLNGLPESQAKVVMTEAVTLKSEVHHDSPDPGRIRHALGALAVAAASAAPVLELVHQLTDLVTQVLG